MTGPLPLDLARIEHGSTMRVVPLDALGLDWPPPERLYIDEDAGQIRPAQPDDPTDRVFIRTHLTHLPGNVVALPGSDRTRRADYRPARQTGDNR